jgi:hypothetical protein
MVETQWAENISPFLKYVPIPNKKTSSYFRVVRIQCSQLMTKKLVVLLETQCHIGDSVTVFVFGRLDA